MMKKILYVTMGPPGSGKNYTAEQLMPKENIFSTDDFYMVDGVYKFDPTKTAESHAWNRDRVEDAMKKGITPICAANTNTTEWERRPYKFMASKFDYDFKILFSESPWFKDIHPRLRDKTYTEADIKVFFEKNTHNVPFDIIEKMMRRWDESV